MGVFQFLTFELNILYMIYYWI